LTRLPPGASTAFFQSDNRHVLLFHMNSDYALHSIVASAAYDAHRPDLSPIGVSLALVQFDIQTRARRVVADLSSLYKPWVDQVPPGMDDYQPIGPSPDGHYFYFKCREMQSENGWGKITANTLYAIRLRDGALIPVAIFPDEFDFRPASGA
jgi:hypothetical protein